MKCFGDDVVNTAFNKDDSTIPRDGSIFAAFAQQGQQVVTVSHQALTLDETRARIALWCSENNHPMKIVTDRQLATLMKAGHPGMTIPSPATISRNIKTAFEASHLQIDKLLREHKGHVHFATDTWTSPNHHAMVAWTVHLHHQGHILVFLLDVLEIPEPVFVEKTCT
ncbi:hypothetical protein H0H92_004643 [Tricholoma furcatifolium]|nr:hypothetical protein H0H92_004643 [Tricholoma furcatifolium]